MVIIYLKEIKSCVFHLFPFYAISKHSWFSVKIQGFLFAIINKKKKKQNNKKK